MCIVCDQVHRTQDDLERELRMALHDGSPPPAEEPAMAAELEAGAVWWAHQQCYRDVMLITSLTRFAKPVLQVMNRPALGASRWRMTMRTRAASH